MILCKLVARGRVQGVNYRWFVRQQALSLGVRGYVKNLPDGSVEIVAEADDAAVMEKFKAIVARKAESGPGPHVEALRTETEKEGRARIYSSFEISH